MAADDDVGSRESLTQQDAILCSGLLLLPTVVSWYNVPNKQADTVDIVLALGVVLSTTKGYSCYCCCCCCEFHGCTSVYFVQIDHAEDGNGHNNGTGYYPWY